MCIKFAFKLLVLGHYAQCEWLSSQKVKKIYYFLFNFFPSFAGLNVSFVVVANYKMIIVTKVIKGSCE
jgi:hypothetical protein